MRSPDLPITSLTKDSPVDSREKAARLAKVVDFAARIVSRWGLVAILLGFGAYKFTAVEAEAIQPLVAHSPFMGWLYGVASVQGVSNMIGISEIAIALLVASHRFSPRAAVVGAAGAVGMFMITLSFIFTTPHALHNPMTLGFLVKDAFLLGAALVAGTESLRAIAEISASD